MLIVPCPNCGPRNAADLRYVGESSTRPDPNTASPEEWRDYLYLEANTAGWLRETWYCRSGCRRYFSAERNTVTNTFRDEPLPGRRTAEGSA